MDLWISPRYAAHRYHINRLLLIYRFDVIELAEIPNHIKYWRTCLRAPCTVHIFESSSVEFRSGVYFLYFDVCNGMRANLVYVNRVLCVVFMAGSLCGSVRNEWSWTFYNGVEHLHCTIKQLDLGRNELRWVGALTTVLVNLFVVWMIDFGSRKKRDCYFFVPFNFAFNRV